MANADSAFVCNTALEADENDDSTNSSLKSLANSEPASRASKNTSFINRDFIAEYTAAKTPTCANTEPNPNISLIKSPNE